MSHHRPPTRAESANRPVIVNVHPARQETAAQTRATALDGVAGLLYHGCAILGCFTAGYVGAGLFAAADAADDATRMTASDGTTVEVRDYRDRDDDWR